MRFNVSCELSDEEIRELAADAARRGVIWGAQYVGEAMDGVFASISPQTSNQIANFIMQMMQQQAKHSHTHGPHAHMPGPTRMPPYPPGYPQPYSPPGPQPLGRVVPLGTSGPMVERCFPIEESRNSEAGWGCCKCATYNNTLRTVCRSCGHQVCGHSGGPIHVGPIPPEPKETP